MMEYRTTQRFLGPAFVLVLLLASIQDAHADAQRKAATFRLESFAIGLDPAFIADTQSRRIADLLHAQLVRGTRNGEFLPEIAASWGWVSPDTLAFELRSGLTFPDGAPITAADAAWSICRLVQPTAPANWLFSNIKHSLDADGKTAICEGIRVEGENTLSLQVTSNKSALLPALATVAAAIVPEGSEVGEYGVVDGAGPYTVEQINANASVHLTARPGGPIDPAFEKVTFQLVPDEATAVALFSSGELDLLEIGNPTLYGLVVGQDDLALVGELKSSDVHQVRLIIFNEAAISEKLNLSIEETNKWVRAVSGNMDVVAIASRFAPLLEPMHTSYFPARVDAMQAQDPGLVEDERVNLTLVTENDAYSDQIAAMITKQPGLVGTDYLGLEKSVLISRLINRQYDMASITLEAMLDHPVYWLSFFKPTSPFTVFGKPIEGLLDADADGAMDHNRDLIDGQGNWKIVASERRFVMLQPWIVDIAFHPTGLLDYASVNSIN